MYVNKKNIYVANVQVRAIIVDNKDFVYDEFGIENTGLSEMKPARDENNQCCALIVMDDTNYYEYVRCTFITVEKDDDYCAAHKRKYNLVYRSYKDKCPSEEPPAALPIPDDMKQRNILEEIQNRRSKLLDCYRYRITYNWLFKNALIRENMIDAGHLFYLESLNQKIDVVDDYIKNFPKKITPQTQKKETPRKVIKIGDVTVSMPNISDLRIGEGTPEEKTAKSKGNKKTKKKKKKIGLKKSIGLDLEEANIEIHGENQKKKTSNLVGPSVLVLPHMKHIDIKTEKVNVSWKGNPNLEASIPDKDDLLSVFGRSDFSKEMFSAVEELIQDTNKLIKVCKEYKVEFDFKNLDDILEKIYTPYKSKEFYDKRITKDEVPSVYLFFETFDFANYISKIEKIANAVLAFIDNMVPNYIQEKYGYPGNIYESYFYGKYVKKAKEEFDERMKEYNQGYLSISPYDLYELVESNWASKVIRMVFQPNVLPLVDDIVHTTGSMFLDIMRRFARLIMTDESVSLVLSYVALIDGAFRSFFSLKGLIWGMNYDINMFLREPFYVRNRITNYTIKELRDLAVSSKEMYQQHSNEKSRELDPILIFIGHYFSHIRDEKESIFLYENAPIEDLETFESLYKHLFSFEKKYPYFSVEVAKVLDVLKGPKPDLMVRDGYLWQRFFDMVSQAVLNGKITPGFVLKAVAEMNPGGYDQRDMPEYLAVYQRILKQISELK